MILKTRPQVATVPAQTVQEGPDGHYVYIIKPDNTVERRTVDVAAIQDGIAVVTKGLSPGERVVVDGQYRLTKVPASESSRRRGRAPRVEAAPHAGRGRRALIGTAR